jgi:predicted nucleotidyltransferase
MCNICTGVKLNGELSEEVKKLVHRLIEDYKPEKIVLFGSLARGDYHEGSDIDLMLVKDTERRFVDRIGDVIRLNNTDIPIEPIVYTTRELERMLAEGRDFVTTIHSEGVVLYERKR